MRTVIFEVKSCKLAETLYDFLEVSVRFIGVILRFGIVSRWFFHDHEWFYTGFSSFREDARKDFFTFNENTDSPSQRLQIS